MTTDPEFQSDYLENPKPQLTYSSSGPKPSKSSRVLILMHGRGATAESILSLYDEFQLNEISAIAPRAVGNSWYPNSFLAPLETNKPQLDRALNGLEYLVKSLLELGISSRHIAILGFSQGACLACEFSARNPRRYGAVMALTGGLIGPDSTQRDYKGSLESTPIFLGTSDPDPHVPLQRVNETKDILLNLDAQVELRTYPGMPHTINREEIDVCKSMLQAMIHDTGKK